MLAWMYRAILASAVVLAVPCFAGWYTGNAGDIYSAEFILTGRDLVQRLRFVSSQTVELPDVNQLSGVVEGVIVHSEEKVYNNGFEVDAANLYPKKNEIILNRSRWREVRRSTETRKRFLIALHEYLWMMGKDDLGFKISGPIIDLLNVENYSPNVYWNPVNPVNILEMQPEVRRGSCELESMNFNVAASTENFEVTSVGACHSDDIRRVVVTKSSSITPPSSGVRGVFHRYKVEVFNSANEALGQLIFEPEWGRCLYPDDGACRSSGKITLSGVELSFGFLRKN